MKETAKRSPEFYEFMEFLKEGTKRTDAELKKHREEFNSEMKSRDERFEAERKKHRVEFEAEMKDRDERLEAELKKHREEFNSEMKSRDERFEAELKKHREEFNSEMKSRDERFEAERKKHRVEFEAEMKDRDKKFQAEMKERQGKADERHEEFEAEMKKSREAYEERQRQSDEQLRELKILSKVGRENIIALGAHLDEVGKRLDGLGFNVGLSAEEYVYRSFVAKPRLGCMKFHSVENNVGLNDNSTELDIVLKNGRSVVVIEVKHRFHPALLDDLPEIAKKKTEAAKQLYPDRQKFYFGIASMSIYDELIDKAKQLGIFLLTQKGMVVKVFNDKVRAY